MAGGTVAKRGKTNRGRNPSFQPAYCQMLKEHMAEGLSLKSFGAKVDASYSTLKLWRTMYPDFEEAYQVGDANRCLYQENQSNRIIKTGGSPASQKQLEFVMRATNPEEYNPSDKLEHSGEVKGGPIVIQLAKEDHDL